MPDWTRELRRRLAAFDLPPIEESRIVEELSHHLADRVAELSRAGHSPSEAGRLALDEISDDELRQGGWSVLPLPMAAEPPPGAPAARWLEGIVRDVGYAIRSLSRQRGFAVASTLALALGIGATTAIVAAVDAVLLRPMPFPHADRLFVPAGQNLARNLPRATVPFADAEDWRREAALFAGVAVWQQGAADLTGAGEPRRVQIGVVSEQFFSLTDVKPVAGRTLIPADHGPGAAQVIVIGHALWQEHFGGASDVVGRQVTLGGVPREIVGVLPARRVWPDGVALFVPMNTAGLDADVRTRRNNMIFNALVRLRDGVSPEQAQSRLTAIAARIEQDFPKDRTGWTTRLVPLREYIVQPETARALYLLLAAVIGVLLIACANVANLALVRGSGRARELAVRVSLGASRWRLIQQLAVEGAVLASAGAVLGVGLAVIIMQGLVAMAPPQTPFLEDIRLSERVLVATVLACALAAIVSGLIPAMSVSTLRVSGALRDGASGSGTSVRTARLRSLLVVAEIAATVVLVTGSALLMRSFDRLSRVDAGVTLDRVVSGRIALFGSRYATPARRQQFTEDLVARLEAAPEVERAALTSFVPAGGGGFGLGRLFLAEGEPEPPAGTDVLALWNVVTPHYFSTLGIRLAAGRPFDTRDKADTTPVMIVSRYFAERMFPNQSPIGKRVRSSNDENVLREVVGVVDEVRYWGLAERQRAPLVYVPFSQDTQFGMLVVARSRGSDASTLPLVIRRALSAVDAEMAIGDLRPLAASAARSVANERYATILLSVLAAVALSLAALGIYGVTSYVFTLRRREMGIRLALGASRRNLYGLVFRQGLVLTGAGLMVGFAGAAASTRWLETLLFNTSPADWAAWLAMVVVVILSTAAACAGPARRAASASPTSALGAE
jgi:putative ABC transport system permease protein